MHGNNHLFRSTSTGAGAGTENVAETGRYCPFFLSSGSVFGLWIRICNFFTYQIQIQDLEQEQGQETQQIQVDSYLFSLFRVGFWAMDPDLYFCLPTGSMIRSRGRKRSRDRQMMFVFSDPGQFYCLFILDPYTFIHSFILKNFRSRDRQILSFFLGSVQVLLPLYSRSVYIHAFINSIHLFIYSFIHLFIHSFIHS